jgi:hypothetical protein
VESVLVLLVDARIKIRNYVRNSFIAINLEAMMQIKVLKEVALIMDTLGCEMFFCRGFAHDIMVGKITRSHEDIDVCALNSDKEKILNAFRKHGYRIFIKSRVVSLAKKYGVKVDIFFSDQINEKMLEFRLEQIIRIPKEFFTYEVIDFMNAKFKVNSNEFLFCITPLIKKESTKIFASNLEFTTQINCHQSEETMTELVTVYNYEKK